ncbi:hypothetical protein [Metabacillus iocasae]|uniref:PspA/IM30 family protein n=1 Tax=Priestia iocasae TaxID=2291674 RepID=A0ABS2QY55_9BACI|nr:hypothetical protein [Metabacillus iocasae]MBM7704406.1 hypothetical protein [Metabacillus iocasae]
MGWFSSFVSGAVKAVKAVAQVVAPIVKSPVPPIFKEPIIFKVAKKIYEYFQGRKYDSSNASIEETKDMNRDLAEYAKTFFNEANRVEEELMDVANAYFDKVIAQLEEMQEHDEFLKELPFKQMKQDVRNLRKEMRGRMKKSISLSYSLDNEDLLAILKIDSDNERVQQLESYSKKVMKDAIDQFLTKIEELSDMQMNLVEELILSKVSQLSLVMDEESALLTELLSAKQQDEQELKNLKIKISATIELCDTALKELQSA